VQHPDADDLALIALGESLGRAVDAHVADCPHCSAEVESLRMTIGLAELSNYGEDAPQPGEHVWLAIAAELGFADAERSSDDAGRSAGSGERRSGTVVTAVDESPAARPPTEKSNGLNNNNSAAPPLRSVPGTGSGSQARPGSGSGSTPPPGPTPIAGSGPAPRRWSRWVAPLAAAAVGIAVGAAAVIVAQNRSDEVTIEATAPLTPVPGGPIALDPAEQLGTAELVAAPTGQQVKVDAPALPPSGNDYEVWLFGDDGRMVSLGTLNDGTGTFTVPQGISTREYRVVDVSDEPPDGNPAHSGISLIRGAFT
jgi:Anti-sigma-K factor rskA